MRKFFAVITVLAFLTSSEVQAQNRELPLNSGDKIGIQVGGISPEDAASINHVYPVGEDGGISIQYLSLIHI